MTGEGHFRGRHSALWTLKCRFRGRCGALWTCTSTQAPKAHTATHLSSSSSSAQAPTRTRPHLAAAPRCRLRRQHPSSTRPHNLVNGSQCSMFCLSPSPVPRTKILHIRQRHPGGATAAKLQMISSLLGLSWRRGKPNVRTRSTRTVVPT